MKYYKMIYDYENDDKFVNCNVGNIGKIGEYQTSNGNIISDWDNVSFEYNPVEGNVLSDYIANVYRWLIVSNKFQIETEILVSNNDQYLPVKIVWIIRQELSTLKCFLVVLLLYRTFLGRSMFFAEKRV